MKRLIVSDTHGKQLRSHRASVGDGLPQFAATRPIGPIGVMFP
jgi:hypothetical protein